MTLPEFAGPGMTVEQWEKIAALATSLNQSQALWISGYFAGLHYARGAAGQGLTETPPLPLTPQAGPAQAAGRHLTILYGSETGNSTAIAKDAAKIAEQAGLTVAVTDMADYKLRQIKDEQDLLIITSTYGEGDPPQTAMDFFEFIESRKAPKLPQLRYAVLGLGDTSYEHFCEAAKRLDKRFAELGATRLQARTDCDVDYEDPAAAWVKAAFEILGTAENKASAPAQAAGGATGSAPAAYDKRTPYPAPILDNIVLTGRGSSKETRHIELSLDGSGLTFEPGDALGFVPQNDPAVVEAVLNQLSLDPSAPITLNAQSVPLTEALEQKYEITTATPRFLTHWAELSGATDLADLCGEDRAQDRAAFLQQHHILDIIRKFPVSGLNADTFVSGLRPLQPRLYSIASSAAALSDEVHLTVATVAYDLHGEPRAGVASGHLAKRGTVDDSIPVYIQPNAHFRLPEDDKPIIMIGAGTGVAPYRAFMQEREARGADGKSWLFFGERNFRTDFLYQTEWQGLLKDGTLSRMDVAFSRDGGSKTYVQQRMQEQGRDLFSWIEDGAYVYVCGDAAKLAPDVHDTLIAIVEKEGGLKPEAAQEYVRNLQRDRRYLRDVY